MNMITGSSSCSAHFTDYITFFYFLADFSFNFIEMGVKGCITVSVFNFYTPAKRSIGILRLYNDTIRRGENILPPVAGKINSRVKMIALRNWMCPPVIRTRYSD